MKKQKLFYLSLLFSSLLLVSILSLLTITPSQAVDPTAAIISGWQGNGLTLRQGTERNSTPLENQQRKVLDTPDDVLSVPGDNKSIAKFVFAVGDVWEYGGLRVQTIPRNVVSEYRFPCRGRGNFTIGWRPVGNQGDRACAEGVKLGSGKNSGWSWWKIIQDRVASRDKLYAQTDDEVTVKPDAGEVIIQTNDTGTGINVDVVLGNVDVTSSRFPNGRTIRAGERYSYPQNTVAPVDVNTIKNTPDFQDFINPNNWLTPDLTDRISQPLSEHINNDLIALGQPITNPQVGLSEEWILETCGIQFSGNCTGIDQVFGTNFQTNLNIIQKGGNLTFSGQWPEFNGISSATISGNQFVAVSNTASNFRLEGTVSSDGNKITGTMFCTQNCPFTLTRKNLVSNDFCNSGFITEPMPSITSHDGSTYKVWTDFSRGKESINPAACGRQYWLKEDASHYNYGIKFVYLVDGRGICVVPFIYKENADGSLESLRAAPECESGTVTTPNLPSSPPRR